MPPAASTSSIYARPCSSRRITMTPVRNVAHERALFALLPTQDFPGAQDCDAPGNEGARGRGPELPSARAAFERLTAAQRQALLRWLATL